MSIYDNQKTDIMMHHTLTIRVISLVKYNQWNMMKFKLLVQGLHLTALIHQLAETLFFRNQVGNIKNERYIIYLICFSQSIHCFIFCEYL